MLWYSLWYFDCVFMVALNTYLPTVYHPWHLHKWRWRKTGSHTNFFFFFPYLRLFPNNLKIPKQSLHSLDSVFCSDKFREEKIDGFESFKHGFLVFLIITVSKNYKMTSKQFSFFKTKKQFPSFAGIAAIMNIFNHSEVIEVTLSDLSNSLNRIRLIWWCNARLNNLFSLLIASVCRCF